MTSITGRQMKIGLSNEDILRRFLAVWATRSAEAMADLFAEDGVYDNVPDKKIRWSAGKSSVSGSKRAFGI